MNVQHDSLLQMANNNRWHSAARSQGGLLLLLPGSWSSPARLGALARKACMRHQMAGSTGSTRSCS
jgi:hypothetical protein